MTIVSARVEANGWVLAVRGVWDASTFSSFNLDPDGVPKIACAIVGSGFDRVGGQAVANAARARGSVVATRPLRRAWPNQALLDEVDHGGGQRTVRLALSRFVHPGETVTMGFAAGWRTGLPSGSMVAGNASTHAVPLVSMRWVTPNRMTQTGPFRVDMLVAHILAEGRDAVAAVKFVATDGTNSVTVWQAGASVSPDYGDGLKCWGATIDPALGVPGALTAGAVTVQAEIYPWIGAMRATGTGHNVTADATGLSAGFAVAAASPLHVAWNPGELRYPARHVFIDTAGTTIPGNVTIGGTLAAAKAGVAAANVSVALNAVRLQAYTAPAANGMPAYTASRRMGEGLIMTLKAGQAHVFAGATTTGSDFTVAEGRVVLQGDPADANARANCAIETGTAFSHTGNSYLFRNLTFRIGTNALPSNIHRVHFDSCTVEGKSGQKSATTGVFTGQATGFWGTSMTRSRWWGYGNGPNTQNRFGFLRNVEVSRQAEAIVCCNLTRIADPDLSGVNGGAGGWVSGAGGAAGSADIFVWGCDLRKMTTLGLNLCTDRVGAAGNPSLIVRQNYINNLLERVGSNSGPVVQIGELTTYSQARYCLFEGNTIVGERLNFGYNNPTDGVTPVESFGNCWRNNAVDWLPTKHDVFTLNGTLTGGWSVLYGVEYEGNILLGRNGSIESFAYEFEGLRTAKNPVWGGFSWGGFVDDQSRYADATPNDAVGGGDYRPQQGSPLALLLTDGLLRARRACVDVFRDGSQRGVGWSAGYVRVLAPVPVDVAVGSSLHQMAGGVAGIGWSGALVGTGAVHPVVDGGTGLAWTSQIVAEACWHPEGAASVELTLAAAQPAADVPRDRVLQVLPEARTLRVL